MSTAVKSGGDEVFLLSDWIHHALIKVDLSALINGSSAHVTSDSQCSSQLLQNCMALCSDEYLIPALKVAHSLADKICECEAEDGVNDNDDYQISSLPTPGTDWADKVQVHISSDHGDNDNVHHIEKADFIRNNAKSEGKIEHDDVRNIYSLGLVFYEIFSGGERPNIKAEQSKEGGEELEDDCAPDIFDGFDFDGEQNILEDLVAEPSIFEDASHDYGNLCNDLGGDDEDFNFHDEVPRKRQTQSSHHRVHDVSVEVLKAKFLPRSLCDLVANMIDNVNGNPSCEDSYLKMTEVRDDLQLMLDKPAIYLYDQDMGKASLQFGDRMFGRNVELSTIKDVYRRSATGESKFVIISGASGYGKSLLAHEFGKHVLAGGGIVLSGKFDQLQQGKPFSALASALDAYCGVLLKDSGPSSRGAEIASKLRSSIGNEASLLTKLIPNLASILGVSGISPVDLNEGCDNGQKRLQYLLCQFIQVISSTFSAPVTLFLDDLQWADTASMEAVLQLLITLGPSSQDKCFFFLGCCREGAIDEEHPVWKLLCKADRSSVDFTNIILDTIDEQAIDLMVSETLCLSPRLTRSLSRIIYHKTHGNPLFVSRLMISLNKEGLLRPSLSRRRWEWDEKKIEQQELPNDVAMFLKNSIRELPKGVQSSLCTLSCFGASAEKSFIRILERALNTNLLDDLDFAVAKGLLDDINDRYRFSHDRIQEATYNMMRVQDRRLFHFTYGLALASLSVEEGSDDILFIAVNQLNHGGVEAVQDPSQCFTIAEMNLRAGKKAMECSDFKVAFSYFDHGMSFLRQNHWTEHYYLSLELFELGARCSLTNGDHARVKLLYEEVLAKAQSFEDTLDITYTNMRALYSASRLEEAIAKLLSVLNELGVVISGDLDTLLTGTKSMLAQYSDEQLLSGAVMTDKKKLMTMKFLSIIQLCLFHANPKSQPKATLQMVQYSLRHGMCGLSSVGFAFYGSFLACIGEIPAGYRYVKFAIKLAEKLETKDCMGDVLAVGGQVLGYVEPLQSLKDVMIRGYEYSLMKGNISSAKLSLVSSVVCEYWSGKQLSLVKSAMNDVLHRMSSQYSTALMLFLNLYRSALAIIGNVDDVPMVLGSRADVETEEERKIAETNMHLLKTVHFNRMYIGFMFRRYDEVKRLADAYDAIASLPFSAILISHCFHLFYWGLINFWVARKTGEAVWLDRGKEAVLKMRSYANNSSWNFSNKLHLLQAEQCFHLNDFGSAMRHYDDAISLAKDFNFVHEEALACELAGYFLLERGEGKFSLSYFQRAQTRYHAWGAYAKEESMKAFIKEQFGETKEGEATWEDITTTTSSTDPRKRKA